MNRQQEALESIKRVLDDTEYLKDNWITKLFVIQCECNKALTDITDEELFGNII